MIWDMEEEIMGQRELIDALSVHGREPRRHCSRCHRVLVVAFIWSIFYGVRQTRLRATEDVFGDPLRTERGWYWAVTGISALLLIWFYFSWGMARAYFPNAGNELVNPARSIRPCKALTACCWPKVAS